jgi:mannose-6-phosphate isomerase-like protein (cupin superfamily)
MPIFYHDQLPVHEVPRIKTRILVDQRCAKQTAVWEQWIHLDGHIPLHYHEVEEVLVILAGAIELTLDDSTSLVRAPATIVVPANQIHGLRPTATNEVHLLAIFPVASPKIYAPDGSERSLPWEDFSG